MNVSSSFSVTSQTPETLQATCPEKSDGMQKKIPILLHKNELNTLGIDMISLNRLVVTDVPLHRDTYYTIIIQQSGSLEWELDFNSIVMNKEAIAFAVPGQVHQYINHKKAKGWFLFVDTKHIDKQYRELLDNFVSNRQVVALQKKEPVFVLAMELDSLLHKKIFPLKEKVIGSLTKAIIGLLVSKIIQSNHSIHTIGSRKYTIVTQYKQLVKSKYKECKQVKKYASLLNITPLYLNEVVKDITGLTAGYWIKQEILLEAKRMLYYTDLDIVEIANELGYEDQAYFSRFFKKSTGTTASDFRNNNHYLSNNTP